METKNTLLLLSFIVLYYEGKVNYRTLFFPKLRVHIKDNNISPHGKFHGFIDFYFHFLANFQT